MTANLKCKHCGVLCGCGRSQACVPAISARHFQIFNVNIPTDATMALLTSLICKLLAVANYAINKMIYMYI